MIRRILVPSLLLLLAFSAFAHNGHVHSLLGTVKSVQTGQLVVAKADGSEMTVLLTDATRYEMGGQTASRTDLATGTRVSVHLADDSKTAVTVKIAGAKSTQ
ncbi:MAG: hypothetical protein ABI779_22085 [Acidobacteriota bacterium]